MFIVFYQKYDSWFECYVYIEISNTIKTLLINKKFLFTKNKAVITTDDLTLYQQIVIQ